MTVKLKTETVISKRILIVTNDSTVFTDKNRLRTAFEMFEGRMTEVKKLVARLDTATKEMCGQVIYPASVLKTSANPAAAQAFLDYLTGSEAMDVFASVGFSPVA